MTIKWCDLIITKHVSEQGHLAAMKDTTKSKLTMIRHDMTMQWHHLALKEHMSLYDSVLYGFIRGTIHLHVKIAKVMKALPDTRKIRNILHPHQFQRTNKMHTKH